MAGTRKLTIEIVGDARSAQRAFNKIEGDAHVMGTGVGRAFASIGRAAATAFAGIGIAAGVGLGASLKLASDLTESINAVNVTFGDAAAGVLDLGKKAATSLGLSSNEFNALAVQFANFSATIAGPFGDTVGVLDDLTIRASDFASVMNLDVAEAARLFQSGLAGETEPLRRFGIDLSAAAVETYAYANGIANMGDELTEAQKVQARYGALMAATAKTQGDFANTSDGAANQARILKATFKDLGAQLGTALLPVVVKLGTFLSTRVVPVLQRHMPAAIDAVSAAFTMAAGVFDRIVGVARWIGENIEYVIPVLAGLATILVGAVVPALIAQAAAAWASASATLAALAPFIAIGAAIAALAAGVVWAYKNWEWFRDAVDGVWKFLRNDLWPILQTVGKYVGGAFSTGVHIARVAFEKIGAAISWVWGHVQTVWDLTAGFRSFVAGVFTTALNVARVAFEKISSAISWVSTVLGNLWRGTEGIRGFLGGAFATGIGIARDAFGFLGAAVQWVIDKISKLVGWIQSAIDKANSALNVLKKLPGVGGALPGGGGGGLGGFGFLAQGGPSVAGRSYIVGENGPELWSERANGFMTPTRMLGTGSSGGGVVVNVNGGTVISERGFIEMVTDGVRAANRAAGRDTLATRLAL